MNSKQFFLQQLINQVRAGDATRRVKILDFGCGTSRYIPALLASDPNIEYVGLEPIAASFAIAQKNIAPYPQAAVYFQLGYEPIAGIALDSFDIVFSLSVLEHVKHLQPFIELSARYVKRGGLLVHRYDLGHALYPQSIKERFHLLLGNKIPFILPERQFVRYVPEPEVRALFEASQIKPLQSTYHQMPNHKLLEKFSQDHELYERAVADIYAWEWRNQELFRQLPVKHREKLFPSVAVWGVKQ